MQNYPELIGVATSGSQVNIQGTLNSTAGRTFRIEFFANDSADASGYGEGQKYLGYVEVTADNAGNANFLTNLSASVAAGKYISATATDLTSNDTSEFAQNVIAKAPRLVIATADGLTTSEDGGNGAVLGGAQCSADFGRDDCHLFKRCHRVHSFQVFAYFHPVQLEPAPNRDRHRDHGLCSWRERAVHNQPDSGYRQRRDL